MVTRFIEVGNPEIDAEFILYGLSGKCEDAKGVYRVTKQKSLIKLKLFPNTDNLLTLSLSVPDGKPQKVKVSIDDQEIGNVELKNAENWDEYQLTVPAKMIGNKAEHIMELWFPDIWIFTT